MIAEKVRWQRGIWKQQQQDQFLLGVSDVLLLVNFPRVTSVQSDPFKEKRISAEWLNKLASSMALGWFGHGTLSLWASERPWITLMGMTLFIFSAILMSVSHLEGNVEATRTT